MYPSACVNNEISNKSVQISALVGRSLGCLYIQIVDPGNLIRLDFTNRVILFTLLDM